MSSEDERAKQAENARRAREFLARNLPKGELPPTAPVLRMRTTGPLKRRVEKPPTESHPE